MRKYCSERFFFPFGGGMRVIFFGLSPASKNASTSFLP